MKGKLTIVYGGQFGSEGKGQIVAYLAQRQRIDYAVRVGGPNAGHTFLLPNGVKQVVQMLPAPAFVTDATCVIGAAGLIIPDLLGKELRDAYGCVGQPIKLVIDAAVGIIGPDHIKREDGLKKSISSTGEGVGAATADKVMRVPELVVGYERDDFWSKVNGLPEWSAVSIKDDTAEWLNQRLGSGFHVLIEGTQGVGLSLHTSGHYPYCTSRECTPQGMLAQTGISSYSASRVERIMVVRTYPIRVGGPSGKLPNEITWAELKKSTGGYVSEPEITTVTKKQRRIAKWDTEQVRRSVIVTRPTGLALSFFDYWYPQLALATDASALRKEHWSRINQIEDEIGVPIKYLSTGFGTVMPLRITL